MAVLAMDTIGHLRVISREHWWALTAIFMHMSYVFARMMKERSVENVVHAYLSGIFTHKVGSIVILSDNGTEFKNAVFTDAYEQCGMKILYSNPFYPQGNSRADNVHNFLKRILTKFVDSSNSELDELLSFACYCYNIFPSTNGAEPPFHLMFGCKPTGGQLTHLNSCSRYYGDNNGETI